MLLAASRALQLAGVRRCTRLQVHLLRFRDSASCQFDVLLCDIGSQTRRGEKQQAVGIIVFSSMPSRACAGRGTMHDHAGHDPRRLDGRGQAARVLSSTRSTRRPSKPRRRGPISQRSTWAPRASVSSASTKSQGRRNRHGEVAVRVVSSTTRAFLRRASHQAPAADVAQPLPHFVWRVRLHDVHALAAASSSILALHLAAFAAELLRHGGGRRRRHGRAPRRRRRCGRGRPGRWPDFDVWRDDDHRRSRKGEQGKETMMRLLRAREAARCHRPW